MDYPQGYGGGNRYPPPFRGAGPSQNQFRNQLQPPPPSEGASDPGSELQNSHHNVGNNIFNFYFNNSGQYSINLSSGGGGTNGLPAFGSQSTSEIGIENQPPQPQSSSAAQNYGTNSSVVTTTASQLNSFSNPYQNPTGGPSHPHPGLGVGSRATVPLPSAVHGYPLPGPRQSLPYSHGSSAFHPYHREMATSHVFPMSQGSQDYEDLFDDDEDAFFSCSQCSAKSASFGGGGSLR